MLRRIIGFVFRKLLSVVEYSSSFVGDRGLVRLDVR